jgi:kynureninase
VTGPGVSISPLDEKTALALDERDPLRRFRDRFAFPLRPDGTPWIYLVGNSLGLMPTAVPAAVQQELDDWARLGVEAHWDAKTPWVSYHEIFRAPGARLVGALPGEVVMMNSLTVNLHLMLATFYQPAPGRAAIAMEPNAFPSDTYAVQSHLRHRGQPADQLRIINHPAGSDTVDTGTIETWLARHGPSTAVLLLPGVNYYTGQLFDLERITRAAHQHGCIVGFDLAHAAGNVELQLHDWDVDFAVWCSYKYLNSGPGAIAGCFVHQRHAENTGLPRLAGWWGNDPETRFLMHQNESFIPRASADGWQLSNPPILAMAPLRVSLQIFDEAGMPALRKKSIALTGFLEQLILEIPGGRIEILTPSDPVQRGCQLSLRVVQGSKDLFDRIQAAGVLCDYRHPDVIRVAPVPLYNSFHDVWRFVQILRGLL